MLIQEVLSEYSVLNFEELRIYKQYINTIQNLLDGYFENQKEDVVIFEVFDNKLITQKGFLGSNLVLESE